jgi:hypothetical protein
MAPTRLQNVSRREILQSFAAAGAGTVLPEIVVGQDAAGDQEWRTKVLAYLETHARKDGGYGWEGQQRGHLTPTFAVVVDYDLYHWPEPPRGTHRATAPVRKVGTRAESWQHAEFTV